MAGMRLLAAAVLVLASAVAGHSYMQPDIYVVVPPIIPMIGPMMLPPENPKLHVET